MQQKTLHFFKKIIKMCNITRLSYQVDIFFRGGGGGLLNFRWKKRIDDFK